MSGHQTATIEDTVYFWFAANDTSGTGGDGATPLYDVREAGAAAGAIPLLSGTPTLLTHANYPAGCHEVAVAATTGNGFAADDTFAVFCTLAIDSQNPTGFVGSCTLTPVAKASVCTETRLSELDSGTAGKVANDTALILADTDEIQQASAAGQYDTAAGFATEAKQDIIDTNVDQIETAVITNAAGTDIAADIIAVKAETANILTDTGTTLQAEVDAIQAAVITNAAGADIAADIIAVKAETANILTDTGTTLQAELDAIQAAVITNAAGADIAADIIAVKAETAAILDDTDLIDDGTSGLAKIATDVAAILVDTGTTIPGLFTFTVAGNVDANVTYVNDVAVTGTGVLGDEWGP